MKRLAYPLKGKSFRALKEKVDFGVWILDALFMKK